MFWLLWLLSVLVTLLGSLWLVGERGHLAMPSTRAAMRQRWRTGAPRGFIKVFHGYVYGRWPYKYIQFCIVHLLPHMSDRLKRWWADRYHGKVLPTELACEIVRLDHDIERTDLDQVIPYPMARDIVLASAPDVIVMECPCRHARENPCQPTDVCMIVGGGDFVLEHHPGRSRRLSQQEALDLLWAEHERGHVHTAYFKDACDDRFYAICNCCPCCCGGLEAMVRHGVPMIASSGFVARVDEAGCIACGDCEAACPFGAISVNEKSIVDWDKCMGCGVCVGQCEMEAVTLVRDERKGVPLDVRTIGFQHPAIGQGSIDEDQRDTHSVGQVGCSVTEKSGSNAYVPRT